MFYMDHCLHVWWDLQRGGEDGSLSWDGRVNGCLHAMRAPSVAGAKPSVVSPSVVTEVCHPSTLLQVSWQMCHAWITYWMVSRASLTVSRLHYT